MGPRYDENVGPFLDAERPGLKTVQEGTQIWRRYDIVISFCFAVSKAECMSYVKMAQLCKYHYRMLGVNDGHVNLPWLQKTNDK